MIYPSITIITGSYNTPLFLWKKMLTALYSQDYPTSRIEHIVSDAGSPEKTLNYIKKFPIKLTVRKDLVNESATRMGMAIQRAKGDLILLLEPDNIIPNGDWLKQMVLPFMENKNLTGAFSMYNTYESDMPIFTKYCALFGINDPVVHYLHKSEKLPVYEKKYTKGEVYKTCSGYTLVRFNKKTLPTLGDNGHMVRRVLLQRVNPDPAKYLHTDAFSELERMGHNRYAVVHNSIIHYTGASITSFLQRRIAYKARDYDTKKITRKYLVYDPQSREDRVHLLLFIVYSLTIVQPLSLSIKGYIAKPELAWFLHPIICFMTTFAYGVSEVRRYMKK